MDSYSSFLTIGSVEPRHDGNYTCVASNAAASTNYTAQLHVDGGCDSDVVGQGTNFVFKLADKMKHKVAGCPVVKGYINAVCDYDCYKCKACVFHLVLLLV